MSNIVVVGLDGVLSPENLVRPTYGLLQEADIVEHPVPNPYKKTALAKIAVGLEAWHPGDIEDIVEEVGDRFMNRLRSRVVRRLEDEANEPTDFVALSTAPDFVVNPVVDRIKEATGLNFTDVLSSRYPTRDGQFTGRYQRLHKLRAVDALLVSRGATEVDAAYVNGVSDIRWTDVLAQKVWPIRPGLAMQRALHDRGQL